MTFLSKLGKVMQIAGKVVQVFLGFAPGIATLIPGKKDDQVVAALVDPLTQVAQVVIQVEAMAQALETPLPGPQKLQMATPIVAQIILASSIMAKHEIHDPELFKKGCASIASGLADILNSIKDDVETINK